MSLPARPTPPLTADPFGLWQPAQPELAPAASSAGVAFDVSDAPGEADAPAAVWQLALDEDNGQQALAQRDQAVQAVATGLAQADQRLERFLSARPAAGAGLSFDVAELAALPDPEQNLALALAGLSAPPDPAASFGLGEDLANLADKARGKLGQLAGAPGVDWADLSQRLNGLVDGIGRQVTHFVWVDSTLNGGLVARTAINWAGDLSTCYLPGLSAAQVAAHARSLQLAVASRAANLRTLLTVTQLAAKITLAVATPLGPLQALGLAWQFAREIVVPLVNQAKVAPQSAPAAA